MSNEFTLTLDSPITEEQWDMITDVDFDYTNEITFHTKHGKTVRFVKESEQPEQNNLMADVHKRLINETGCKAVCRNEQWWGRGEMERR